MPNYQWPSDSFQAEALRAAFDRKANERREEQERQARAQRAREERFASLLAPIFGNRWYRLQEQHHQQRLRDFDTRPFTEYRYQELTFTLVDVDGQKEPVLSVSAECSKCGQAFERHPIGNSADVGDLLAELQQHPDCVHPMAKDATEENRRRARHALDL